MSSQSEVYTTFYNDPYHLTNPVPYGYSYMQNMDNSRAMLMEYPQSSEYYMDPYREREVRRTGKRLRRANSDLTQHSTRRPKVRKQRGETPFDNEERRSRDRSRDAVDGHGHVPDRQSRRSQSDERQLRSSDNVTKVDVHRPKKQAPVPPVQNQRTEISDPQISESATDSAKLRPIERERAREKENAIRTSNNQVKTDYSRENKGYVHDEPKSKDVSDLHINTYNYEGKPSKYENPVVAKMAAMVETPKATLIPANKASVDHNSDKINVMTTTTFSSESFHAEVTKKLEKLQGKGGNLIDSSEGPVATSTGKKSRSSRPTSGRARRGSGTDQDGKVVTDEFEFLEGYSDGEGTDFMGSGNLTPTQMRDYDVTF